MSKATVEKTANLLYFLEEVCPKRHKSMLPALLLRIAESGMAIQSRINSDCINGVLCESLETENTSGETQVKLDLVAHNTFIENLTKETSVAGVASEESEDFIDIHQEGKYIVALDPLDGSSNLIVNGPVGSIFSIYERVTSKGKPTALKDYLQPGNKQIAAGYLLFGPRLLFVFSIGSAVHGFTYSQKEEAFVISHPVFRIPKKGNTYSVNDAYLSGFPEQVRLEIEERRIETSSTARYTGALVADFHRILMKGGIFLYPPNELYPMGKLRLAFECNPLAFLALHAGGRAHNGTQEILFIHPDSLHERTPLYIGSSDDLEPLWMEF